MDNRVPNLRAGSLSGIDCTTPAPDRLRDYGAEPDDLPIVIAVRALQAIAALQSRTSGLLCRTEEAWQTAEDALKRIENWR